MADQTFCSLNEIEE